MHLHATLCLGPALTLALAVGPRPAAAAPPSEATPTAPATARDPTAVAAYAAGGEFTRTRDYDDAVAKLDLASELEPDWPEPVRLRAEIFATLAERYHPSAAFMSARAAELQRLRELEPAIDATARSSEIASLQQRSEKARRVEQRRRKLAVPAALVILSSAAFLGGGAMLYGMKPREALEPGSFRQERRDRAAIAMMAIGGILLPPGIVLGVLAARQARRDSAQRDFDVHAGRPRPTLGVAPRLGRRGGGVALELRF